MNRLWRRYRPRSVRARLVATYTVVAVVLAAGGIVVFSELLHKGLDASLDATLQTRLAPLVSSVQAPDAGGLAEAGPTAPDSNQALGPARAADEHGGVPAIDSFSVIYRPDGRIAQIEPTAPRFAPLTADQITRARNGPEQFNATIGDDQLRVSAAPVIRSDGTWVAAVGSNGDAVTDAADRATHELLLAVPFLILAAAVGAWLLSGAALRPVERLRSDAARLGAHDPESRLRVPDTADELARLAETFNGLLDRLQRSVARQRDLVADAGHELRTPLAVLRTELDLADGPRRSRADLADSITHARSEVDRLCQLAEDLLFLARADENAALIVPVPADLREVVNEATRAARASADLGSVHLISDVDEALPALADPSAVRRAMDNLLANAVRATPSDGTVTVSAHRDAHATVITVADTGPGFPEPFLAHAFERFRRPDDSRTAITGGAGLGLAIVAEIARAHQGSVTAANQPQGGALITLRLPDRSPADFLLPEHSPASDLHTPVQC
jgi:two-component system OmpR family sensor kinase